MYKVVETNRCVGRHRTEPEELNHCGSKYEDLKEEEYTIHILRKLSQWWNSKLRARRCRKTRICNQRFVVSSDRCWEEKWTWCFSWLKQTEYLLLKVRFDDWKICRSSLEHRHGLLKKMREILRQLFRGKMYLMFFLVEAKWVSCSQG